MSIHTAVIEEKYMYVNVHDNSKYSMITHTSPILYPLPQNLNADVISLKFKCVLNKICNQLLFRLLQQTSVHKEVSSTLT